MNPETRNTSALLKRSVSVLFWGEAERLGAPSMAMLTEEFTFYCEQLRIPEQRVSAPSFTEAAVTDDVIRMAEEEAPAMSQLVVILSPVPLYTPFGYHVVGESRGRVIAISTTKVRPSNLARVLRHEVGHYFGIDEHLGCVMSPYQVDDFSFCAECISRLHVAGVEWRAMAGLTRT